MVTQLADHGPNPDLRRGKFRPRPTIGPSQFFGQELIGCLMHVEWQLRVHSNRGVDLFFNRIVVCKSDGDLSIYILGVFNRILVHKTVEELFFGLQSRFRLQKQCRPFCLLILESLSST